MILYNVTVSIDPNVHDEWLDYMRSTHIPEVLKCGLFIDNKICRVHAEEEGGLTYAIQYLLRNWEDYHRYQKEFAPALQQDHSQRYAGKFAAFRTVLEVIHHTQL